MLTGLQHIRAFAASIVVFYHVIISSVFTNSWLAKYSPYYEAASVGVDIFFLLSGFIIAYSVFEKSKSLPKAKFFLLRVVRIFPLYLIFTLSLFTLLMSPVTKEHHFSFEYLFRSFLLLPVLDDRGKPYPLLLVGWTLVLEMYFYIGFCIVYNRNKWLSLVLLTLLFSSLFVFAESIFDDKALVVMMSSEKIFLFLFGFLLYNCYSSNLLVKLLSVSNLTVVLLSIFFWCLFVYLRGSGSNISPIVSTIFTISIMVLALKYTDYPKSFIAKFSKILGDASYNLYLSHTIILLVITGMWKRGILAPKAGFEFVYILMAMAVCVVFSVMFYLCIERHINHYFSNKVKLFFEN